jgi:Na+/H+ antiporter NhaC
MGGLAAAHRYIHGRASVARPVAAGQGDSTPAPTGTVTGSSSGSAVYWAG